MIIVDLYLISMAGSNVVLGTQWLKRLGPILYDYEKFSMSFKLDGKTITWHGESIISDDPFSASEHKCLQTSSTEAYLLRFELCQDPITTVKDNQVPEFLQPDIANYS